MHIKLLLSLSQERIRHLEEDLNDERSSSDRLMERLDKTKEQASLFLLYPVLENMSRSACI